MLLHGGLAAAQTAEGGDAPADNQYLAQAAGGPHGMMARGGMMPGGGKQGMMCDMMPGMPSKMAGEMRGHGGMGMGGSANLMVPFHIWIGKLFAHREHLGLTDENVKRFDELISAHMQKAVRQQAEIEAQAMGLKYLVRNQPEKTAPVEDSLKKLADLEYQLRLSGIQLYNTIMKELTPDQRAQVGQMVGSPFPPPWHGMDMMHGGTGASTPETGFGTSPGSDADDGAADHTGHH